MERAPPKPGFDRVAHRKAPRPFLDLGAGVPTGTLTAFPVCAGLLIGFADRLLDEAVLE